MSRQTRNVHFTLLFAAQRLSRQPLHQIAGHQQRARTDELDGSAPRSHRCRHRHRRGVRSVAVGHHRRFESRPERCANRDGCWSVGWPCRFGGAQVGNRTESWRRNQDRHRRRGSRTHRGAGARVLRRGRVRRKLVNEVAACPRQLVTSLLRRPRRVSRRDRRERCACALHRAKRGRACACNGAMTER